MSKKQRTGVSMYMLSYAYYSQRSFPNQERMTAEEAQHHPWLSNVEGLSLGGPQKGTGVVPIDEVLLL